MSTENTTSAATVTNSPATQGANPVQKLETRGENDFARQLEAQGGAEQTEAQTTTQGASATDNTQSTTTATQATTVAQPATQSAATNAETIRSVVEATIAGMGKASAQQTQPVDKELTAAEFNAKYGIPTVDAAFMQRILDADPAKGAAALQSLIIQAVRSGALISKDLFTTDLQKFRGEVEPSMKYYQTEQQRKREESLRTEFYSLNKDLVGEEALVDELTAAMVARVNAGQLKISSKEEGFKLVADAAKKIVARMNKPGTQGTQAGGTAQAGAPATRQMSAASSAGRSGTGQQTQKSDVDLVFGADAR